MSLNKPKLATLISVLLAPFAVLSGAEPAATYKHYIPEDKGLHPAWIASLTSRGQRKVYQGQELNLIGMPCGGIGAGQIEISGTGTLGTWWIFNKSPETNGGMGYSTGARYLKPAPIEKVVENGFAIRIKPKNGNAKVLKLDGSDFDAIRFVGEYPIAGLEYRSKEFDLPVRISSEVFSPFVPLSVRDSANPVTALRFTVENTSDVPVNIDLGGWLENVCVTKKEDQRINQVFNGDNLTGVQLGLKSQDNHKPKMIRTIKRDTLVFDTFENKAFGKQWTAEGKAFDDGTLKVIDVVFNLPVEYYQGDRIATSFHSERLEDLVGTLISEPFKIERNSISFKIGGGNHKDKTCINLIVDDKVVRTATGNNSNSFAAKSWNVADLEGKAARLEIVDQQNGSWGFVMVDDILFVDSDKDLISPYGNGEPGYGNLAISVLDNNASASAGWTSVDDFLKTLADDRQTNGKKRFFDGEQVGGGSVISSFALEPDESKTVTFLVSWYFPNLHNDLAGGYVGHIYNNWYNSSSNVAQWVADHYQRLYEQTDLFRVTYHDTTLPYWLANRITMPVSTLACDNIKIHANGRMYAFEGVSFCYGTCGHVYNFVTAIANLFPELERSVRLLQDFDERYGYDPKTGRVNFRGHDGPDPTAQHDYASDAQSGYILKTYREHLHSPDLSFLKTVWPKVKLSMNYQVFRDGAERSLAPNGVLESKQTFWDPMWWWPNPYNNTLYLAALRASEEMARLMGEDRLANRYHVIFESGSKWMQKHMWNGQHYVHLYPEGKWSSKWNGIVTLEEEQRNAAAFVREFSKRDNHYYASTGCDAQQLFGQNWANQLGLGDILPPEQCRSAAASIFKYNWTPDISLVYKLYPPKHRTLAASGEGVLVNGAWPKVRRQNFENIHDKDDAWTGLEYEAACDMINAGLLDKALIVLRAIHDRYDAGKRNPWNEIEGAEHYSRAMHSWNVLLALSGSTYDGPAGEIGFSPRITPDDFKSFFSAAQGWGTFQQKRANKGQTSNIRLKYGQLQLKTLAFDVSDGLKIRDIEVTLGERNQIKNSFKQEGRHVMIELATRLMVTAGQTLQIEMR